MKMNDKNETPKIVKSFSLYSNASSILNLENSGRISELKFLHGIRVIALFLIVLSHTYGQGIWPVPAINSNVMFDWLKNPMTMMLFYLASPATECFFIISAMLLTSKVFRELDKT